MARQGALPLGPGCGRLRPWGAPPPCSGKREAGGPGERGAARPCGGDCLTPPLRTSVPTKWLTVWPV